ncbi:MAG: nitroreductase family protein [Thermodesulfobacteriota bacterium]
METYELILTRRSVRRFKPEAVPEETLRRMVNAARLAPSAGNLQPLRYLVVTSPDLRARVFEALKWAAYITPAGDPPPGHEPAAYVIVLADERVRSRQYQYDAGLAAGNLLLAGLAEGVAGCVLLSFNRRRLRETFALAEHLRPVLVSALGYPDEAPVSVDRADTVRYWRDERGRHFVPKRPLDQVMSFNMSDRSWE